MVWILIGLGAGLGSVLRYEIGRQISRKNIKHKIFATFAVNISGAMLLGIVVGLSLEGLWWSLLADGFLGGFTTFSTLMVEGVELVRGNQKKNALLYFTLTMILGITAFLLGNILGVWFYSR